MKVETASSTKYSSKLTTEYNKLKDDKQKYDYIRTIIFIHKAVITFHGHDLVTASQITMSNLKIRS